MRISRTQTRKVAAVEGGLALALLAMTVGCGAAEREAASADGPSRTVVLPAPTNPDPASTGTAADCSAGTVERRPLVLADGLHAYVEPATLMQVGDDLLLVGSPSYTWELGADTARRASENAHIAFYLDDEDPRMVPNPFGRDVGFTRAVALDGGRWGVLGAYRGENALSRTAWVRYAEYSGSWSTVEDVPLPPDGASVGTSSALVRYQDELVWAAVDESFRGGVYLYRRRAGVWSVERILERGLEAAALDVGPSGLWLAAKGLDPGVQGPRKSVRLFHWDDGWRLVTRDPTPETYTEIDNLELLGLPGGATVTWIERTGAGVARARVGVRPDSPGSVVLVDEAAPVVRSFATGLGTPGWVLQHVDAARRASDLRLVLTESGDDGPHTVVAQETPLPYTGLFDAHAIGPSAVLVTGAEFSPDPARATVRSLTLRLSPSCR